jgi:hypothetical protein
MRTTLDLAPVVQSNTVDDLIEPGARIFRRIELVDCYDEGVLNYVDSVVSR